MSGVVTGTLLGVSAGMYASTKMSPRQRRKLMKKSRKMFLNMVDNMDLF